MCPEGRKSQQDEIIAQLDRLVQNCLSNNAFMLWNKDLYLLNISDLNYELWYELYGT